MRIGIDLDDVIVKFFPSFLNFYNEKYGKNRNIEELSSYHIWEVGIGRDKEEAIKLVDEFYKSEEFDKIPLVKGAGEGIRKLNDLENDLFVITARPLRFREKTEACLEKYFSNSLKIFYASGLEGRNKTKAEICERLGVETMIEDAPKYALDCNSRGIRTLLMDRPWNRSLNGKLERVYNWNEILEKLL